MDYAIGNLLMLKGAQVLVHNPYAYPDVASKGLALGEKIRAFIGVGATYTERYTYI